MDCSCLHEPNRLFSMFINIEIKARCHNPDRIREYLLSQNADFRGTDEQTDTYFHSKSGRLKLREGLIENNLIYYQRPDNAGPKSSQFDLVKVEDPERLKKVLTETNGIKVVVKKIREIYFIDNVKFHIDTVPGLGHFMEIEAGNKTNPLITENELRQQCDLYISAMGIRQEDMLERSYSDMLTDNDRAQVPG